MCQPGLTFLTQKKFQKLDRASKTCHPMKSFALLALFSTHELATEVLKPVRWILIKDRMQ
jgi:hypothetical protein